MRRQNNESSDRGSVTTTCTFLVDETHFPGTAWKIVPKIRAMHGPNHLTLVPGVLAPAQSYLWSTPKSQSPFCLACQVPASSFYVIPYGFQMLRIFPKKLDEPCDLVNSDWLNVVLNSFRILMCRCFLHSDHREELRDYPMPRDYGSGHLLSFFGKLHSS